jgi:hypothetical protein
MCDSAWGALVRVQLLTVLVLPNSVLQNYCGPCMVRRTETNVYYSASCNLRSRDSSVGIATGYGLDDHGGWAFESR